MNGMYRPAVLMAVWAGMLFLPSATVWAAPMRIVSLNVCADQLVTMLVPERRIVALSFLSRDPDFSFIADRVERIPITHGSAEEILPLDPDLVIAGVYTTRETVRLLQAHGIPVLELDLPQDFDGIRRQVRELARELDAVAMGEALIADMDERLAAVAVTTGNDRPRALVYQANSFTAGDGTLADAVIEAAGFDNFATRAGLVGYGYLPLEIVVAGHPDLLIAGYGQSGGQSLSEALLRHPALRLGAGRRLAIPSALWACAGPFTVGAVEVLAEARRRPAEGRR